MENYELMKEAIKESRKCTDEYDQCHPKVGAIVVKNGEIIARGYRGEIPGSHAEEVALGKVDGEELIDAVMYTTLEPCTTVGHPDISCAEMIRRRQVKHVVIGMLDPNMIAAGRGLRYLTRSGVKVSLFPNDLMNEIKAINSHYDRQFEQVSLALQIQKLEKYRVNVENICADVKPDMSLKYIRKLPVIWKPSMAGAKGVSKSKHFK